MDNDTFQQVSIVQEPYKPKCLLRRSLCPSTSKACAVAVELNVIMQRDFYEKASYQKIFFRSRFRKY